MRKEERVYALLKRIEEALEQILRRVGQIETADDFYVEPHGRDTFDAICMSLIVVGETLKTIDRHTNSEFLISYDNVPWQAIKGIRDVIAHEYFIVDREQIFDVCVEDVPVLLVTIQRMLNDI